MRTTGGSWLGAAEVASRLGIPVRTVLELAREGALPAERQPVGAPRFRWSEIVSVWSREIADI